jgi:dimeric dUTPase (all-alpha-NTP-PPase superfamily)
MAALQEAHNVEVAPDWRSRGFPYHRAIWVECAELLDHFGWKWWKHQAPDAEQVRLELVDIWHFGLSMLLLEGPIDDGLVDTLGREVGRPRSAEAFRTDVEALAAAAVAEQRFSLEAFVDCMNSLGLSLEDLYRAYVGKNVLNNFRQHHGYRDGSYRKLWAGREDNAHLMELVVELDPDAEDFAEHLYLALEARYEGTA